MAKELLPDAWWLRIAPLIPPEAPKPKGGRPRVSERAALTGILFVLKTGTPWEYLPAEMGCGSGMTCWRRLRDWFNRFRRLKIRYKHRADIHLAFLQRRLAPSSHWGSSANTLVAVLSSDSTCPNFSGSLVIGEDHTV